MEKLEKEYLLSLFLKQNESDDIISLANECFGLEVHYVESSADKYKSIFDIMNKKIILNGFKSSAEESKFLVSYHIAEYVLNDDKKLSIVRLDNMDVDVYKLAQKIYQKSEDIKNKQLKKGR